MKSTEGGELWTALMFLLMAFTMLALAIVCTHYTDSQFQILEERIKALEVKQEGK